MHAWWVIFIVFMAVGVAACVVIALCFLVTKTLLSSRKKKGPESYVSSLVYASKPQRRHDQPKDFRKQRSYERAPQTPDIPLTETEDDDEVEQPIRSQSPQQSSNVEVKRIFGASSGVTTTTSGQPIKGSSSANKAAWLTSSSISTPKTTTTTTAVTTSTGKSAGSQAFRTTTTTSSSTTFGAKSGSTTAAAYSSRLPYGQV